MPSEFWIVCGLWFAAFVLICAWMTACKHRDWDGTKLPPKEPDMLDTTRMRR